MKNPIFLLFVPLMFFLTLSAQVTQEQADQIVIERMSNDAPFYILYAKADVQTGFEITTATGEILELDYSCWVYYVNFIGTANGKYLIVKENTGNVLEVNTKNDGGPDDLENWRIVIAYPIDIPFTEYLEDSYWEWKHLKEEIRIINNSHELEVFLDSIDRHIQDYPVIDFENYSLILATGMTTGFPAIIENKQLQEVSKNRYFLYLNVWPGIATTPAYWVFAITVSKLSQNTTVELIVESY